jgi:hypothetical protein
MRRFYGMGWDEARALPLTEVADMVAHLPPEAAVHRAADPHWRRTNEVEILRLMEHGIRVLGWQKTRDGQAGRNVPEPLPMPWDPPTERGIRGDSMTWDEAADWFDWAAEMDGYFDAGGGGMRGD